MVSSPSLPQGVRRGASCSSWRGMKIRSGNANNNDNNMGDDPSGKYVRYNNEKVEVLEQAYQECSTPSLTQRQKMIQENPILHKIEPNQIKIWFQNRRCHLGEELLNSDNNIGLSVLTILWNHRDPILCFSLTSGLVFTFANQAGLDMLGTTMMPLQGVTLDTIFDGAGQDSLGLYFYKTMEEGATHLPFGTCRQSSYKEAIAWKVYDAKFSLHCIALAFSGLR